MKTVSVKRESKLFTCHDYQSLKEINERRKTKSLDALVPTVVFNNQTNSLINSYENKQY